MIVYYQCASVKQDTHKGCLTVSVYQIQVKEGLVILGLGQMKLAQGAAQ